MNETLTPDSRSEHTKTNQDSQLNTDSDEFTPGRTRVQPLAG